MDRGLRFDHKIPPLDALLGNSNRIIEDGHKREKKNSSEFVESPILLTNTKLMDTDMISAPKFLLKKERIEMEEEESIINEINASEVYDRELERHANELDRLESMMNKEVVGLSSEFVHTTIEIGSESSARFDK